MKFAKLTVLIIFTIYFSSCKTYKTTNYNSQDIAQRNIVQLPLVAELVVDSSRVKMRRSYNNVTLVEARSKIIIDLLDSTKADVMVAPLFNTNANRKKMFSNNWDEIEIELSGHVGIYSKIRPVKDSDTLLVQNSVFIPQEKPIEEEITKNPRTLKTLAYVFGGLLLLSLFIR
jgi:hypothetical protein